MASYSMVRVALGCLIFAVVVVQTHWSFQNVSALFVDTQDDKQIPDAFWKLAQLRTNHSLHKPHQYLNRATTPTSLKSGAEHRRYPRNIWFNGTSIHDDETLFRLTNALPSRTVNHLQGDCLRCRRDIPIRLPILEPFYNCDPIADWQTKFHPTCNLIHEVPFAESHTADYPSLIALIAVDGGVRTTWGVANYMERFVMKVLRLELDINRMWDQHRHEAMAHDQLTKSPRIVDFYGFCGHSSMSEVAQEFGYDILQKLELGSIERYEIGLETTRALVDVHSIDFPNSTRPTLSHSDLHENQIVRANGTIKLNDFNRAIPLRMNGTQPCKYPNIPGYYRWRPPETFFEADPAKADIYSIGNLYYVLLTGYKPWKDLEPGGYMDATEVRAAKKSGRAIVPFVPKKYVESNNVLDQALYNAAMACFGVVPEERPSSYELAVGLETALEWVRKGKNTTRQDVRRLFHKG